MSATSDNWEQRLPPEALRVLRDHGTEPPGSSALLNETRPGTYVCAACDHPLFKSDRKYHSGTGWPSFYEPIEGAFNTSTDYSAGMVRTEYHCAKCGGHHGHVFEDGPRDKTGLRYCNNGVALRFIPD